MSAWRHDHDDAGQSMLPLIAGAAVLVLAVFALALFTARTLTDMHVRHKMESLARQAGEVLRQHASTTPSRLNAQGELLLEGLMRFRDVDAMRVEMNGATLWAAPAGFAPRVAPLASGAPRVYSSPVDGMDARLALARHEVMVNGARASVLLRLDITGLAASYRAIALLVAKLVSAVLIAAFLAIGLLLMRRRTREEGMPDMERLHDEMTRQLRARARRMRQAEEGHVDGEAGGEKQARRRAG